MSKHAHKLSIGITGKVGELVYQRVKKGRGNIPMAGPRDLQLRAHAPQTDARTPEQLRVRARLAAATAAYQALTPEQRAEYLKLAQGSKQTGYNRFVAEYCRAHPL